MHPRQKGTLMKYSRILLAAAVSAVAFGAQAQVGTHGEVGGTPQAKAAGETPKRPSWAPKSPWSTAYNPLIDFHSVKTREQVRAELMEGRQMLLAYEGLLPGYHLAFFSTPQVAY
jgi:hypothetical protein